MANSAVPATHIAAHDEVIVHQIKAIGIGGQAIEQPRMFGGKMQTDGDRQNAVDADDAALDARRADADSGKELDGIKQRPALSRPSR
jgi:hypothetical protein